MYIKGDTPLFVNCLVDFHKFHGSWRILKYEMFARNKISNLWRRPITRIEFRKEQQWTAASQQWISAEFIILILTVVLTTFYFYWSMQDGSELWLGNILCILMKDSLYYRIRQGEHDYAWKGTISLGSGRAHRTLFMTSRYPMFTMLNIDVMTVIGESGELPWTQPSFNHNLENTTSGSTIYR